MFQLNTRHDRHTAHSLTEALGRGDQLQPSDCDQTDHLNNLIIILHPCI